MPRARKSSQMMRSGMEGVRATSQRMMKRNAIILMKKERTLMMRAPDTGSQVLPCSTKVYFTAPVSRFTLQCHSWPVMLHFHWCYRLYSTHIFVGFHWEKLPVSWCYFLVSAPSGFPKKVGWNCEILKGAVVTFQTVIGLGNDQCVINSSHKRSKHSSLPFL